MGKPAVVNPIKASPALGAAYALQGVKGAMPLFHAGPGCTFLGKVLLTQHTKEPVGLAGTDMKEMTTILGGWDLIETTIEETFNKFKPSVVAVISLALSEVRGEDVKGIVKKIKEEKSLPLVFVEAPDYKGDFSSGFADAILQLIQLYAKKTTTVPTLVNVLFGPHHTAGDVEEILDILSSFGFSCIALPDFSTSIDGSKEKFSNTPSGGVTTELLCNTANAEYTLVLSPCMENSAVFLKEQFGIPFYKFDSLYGLSSTDSFIKKIMELSHKNPTEKLKRQRLRLKDALVDTHLMMARKKIALAGESDHVYALHPFLTEIGVHVTGIISTSQKNYLKNISTPILIGDLEDVEDMALSNSTHESIGIDLIFANSHARELASRYHVAHIKIGFPVFDEYGALLKTRVGYKGGYEFIFEIANAMDSAH